jgi:hypothetical protein
MKQKMLTTALSVRELDPDVASRFRSGARARGITQAEYLNRLLDLHDALKASDKQLARAFLRVCDLHAVTH